MHRPRLISVVFAALVLVPAVVIALRFMGPKATDEDAARDAERRKAWVELQVENKTKLGTFAWVDRAKGTVQIPIATAIPLTIADLNRSQPKASPTPPLEAAPAPAAAAPAAPTSTPAAP